jgi:carbon monoxide dehydrogenase subunit G
MELSNEFDMSAPAEVAWAVLTDVERIAPCLPGAELQEVEGDEYRGVVKVKVGPINARFKGKATFVERDEAARTAVLRAEGRDTSGKGNANATITARLEPNGDRTHVSITTDLNITGRIAQFGRGALADISAKLLSEFAHCLEHSLLPAGGGEPGDTEPAGDTEPPAEAPAKAEEPAPPTPEVPAAAVAEEGPVHTAPDAPAVRRIEGDSTDPLDLLEVAGAPLARRAAPLLGLAAVVVIILAWRRRRR